MMGHLPIPYPAGPHPIVHISRFIGGQVTAGGDSGRKLKGGDTWWACA